MRKASPRRWKSTLVQPIPRSSICLRNAANGERVRVEGAGFDEISKNSHLAAKWLALNWFASDLHDERNCGGENSYCDVREDIWQKSEFLAHLSISFREQMGAVEGGGTPDWGAWELESVKNIQVSFVAAPHWALGGNTNLKLCSFLVRKPSLLIYLFHQSGGVRVFSPCFLSTFSYTFINCSFAF